MHVRRFAGVVALHANRIALVQERQENWGADYWSIPSGELDRHETPTLGAVRELAEETGLVVAPGALTLVGTSSTTHEDSRFLAWNFTVAVDSPRLAVADPDRAVLQARWFTREEAIEQLGQLPYRPLAEPVIAHLTGTVDLRLHWRYDSPDADPVVRWRRK